MQVPSPIIDLLETHPRLAGAFGLAMALLFAVVGVMFFTETQRMPPQPVEMRLAQVADALQTSDDIWVTLPDVSWDYGNIVYDSSAGRTEVVFTNAGDLVLGVAEFSGKLSCNQVQGKAATGVLSLMGDTFFQRLSARGFQIGQYSQATKRFHLCGFCGRSNSMGMVAVCIFMVLAGLWMFLRALKSRHISQG